MDSFRTAVAAVLVALVLSAPAYARHSYPATYTGTLATGGTVSFDVNADGTMVTNFTITSTSGAWCGGNSPNFGGPDAITNHSFSRGTIGGPSGLSYTGTFSGFQQASGQVGYRVPMTCNTDTTWTATTTAPPPPQCNDGVDNDGDGLTDYPVDFACLSASGNDEDADNTAPSPPSISGTSPSPPSSDDTPKVTGTGAEAGSTVKIYGDVICAGPVLGSGAAADFNGTKGVVATVPANQETQLRATATDAAGNASGCSPPFAYTHDSQAPDTTITAGPSGATTDNTPTFEFSSNDAGATFSCQVDLGSVFGCTSPHTTAALASGAHTFSVSATDAAGNADPTPASSSFAVETTGQSPDPGTTGPSPDPGAQDTSVSLTASAPRRQRALKQKGLVAFAACSGEPCSVRATGYVDIPPAGAAAAKRFKLRSVQRALVADARTKLKLRCSRRLLRKIRAALGDPQRRRRVRALIRVRATDAAGNAKSVSLKVKIKR